MKKYNAKWFDLIEWGWIDKEFIAISESQLREYIDSQCKPEYRYSPWRGDKEDSLEIEYMGDVTLPYEV